MLIISTYYCIGIVLLIQVPSVLASLHLQQVVYTSNRWDMSVEEDVYCQQKARSISTLEECSKHSKQKCNKHLGCIHPLLLKIELDHLVLDELHLMLRIDVLFRNLILYADSRDHTSRERGETCRHVQQLQQAIQSCGVSFQIWQKKEPSGKPLPGSYDWTALSGKHKLQVLQKLPEKMATFLPDATCTKIANLWNVRNCMKKACIV